MMMNAVRPQLKDKFSTRPRLSQQNSTTIAAGAKFQKAAPPPPSDKYGGGFFGRSSEVAFNPGADDRAVVKKEFKSSWLKIPKSGNQELNNRKPNKKKSRTMRLLDTIDGREKVEWLKQTRDYSFLSSSDEDISCGNIIPKVLAVEQGDKPMNMMKDKGLKKTLVSKNISKKAAPLEEEIISPRIKKASPKVDPGKKRKSEQEEEEEINVVSTTGQKRKSEQEEEEEIKVVSTTEVKTKKNSIVCVSKLIFIKV